MLQSVARPQRSIPVEIQGSFRPLEDHLQPIDGGTRLTLRHTGFVPPDSCGSVCEGWQSSFEQLTRTLSAAATRTSAAGAPED